MRDYAEYTHEHTMRKGQYIYVGWHVCMYARMLVGSRAGSQVGGVCAGLIGHVLHPIDALESITKMFTLH